MIIRSASGVGGGGGGGGGNKICVYAANHLTFTKTHLIMALHVPFYIIIIWSSAVKVQVRNCCMAKSRRNIAC